jgi:hypothetical protein
MTARVLVLAMLPRRASPNTVHLIILTALAAGFDGWGQL